MPLRSASGSEAQAYIDFGQLADSALNLGIAEYFQGMAIVESVDPRKPDGERLREAGGHLATARAHIARSADAGRRMMGHVPSTSKEASDFFRMRLASTMKMTEALDSVIGKVHT